MDKNVNVSIGGAAFVLDSEAYRLLKDYTVRIEVGYRENPDGAEILSDIESRISELILSEQSPEEVVSAALIKKITDQLGLPDDLSSETEKAVPTEEEENIRTDRIQRRLYRNPEGAKLGGVCSGLGSYFDVDPVLIRFLFFLPLLMTPVFGILHWHRLTGFSGTMVGVFFLLYFVLWIIIPKARTPLQKLEMKGKKITASSIERNFYDDLVTTKSPEKSEKSASVLTEVASALGQIILFCIKLFLLIIGLILAVAAIGILVGLATVLVKGYSSLIVSGGFEWLSPTEYVVIAILIGLVLLLPLIVLGFLLFRAVFGLPRQNKALAVVSGIWVLILIFMSIFAARNIENIRHDLDGWNFRNGRFVRHYDPPRHREMQSINDSVYLENIQIGDSTVIDTVRREYFTE